MIGETGEFFKYNDTLIESTEVDLGYNVIIRKSDGSIDKMANWKIPKSRTVSDNIKILDNIEKIKKVSNIEIVICDYTIPDYAQILLMSLCTKANV